MGSTGCVKVATRMRFSMTTSVKTPVRKRFGLICQASFSSSASGVCLSESLIPLPSEGVSPTLVSSCSLGLCCSVASLRTGVSVSCQTTVFSSGSSGVGDVGNGGVILGGSGDGIIVLAIFFGVGFSSKRGVAGFSFLRRRREVVVV